MPASEVRALATTVAAHDGGRRGARRATSIRRARWPANPGFCCAFALWRGCPTPTSAWPGHAENGWRNSGAAHRETRSPASSRMRPACPTSTTALDEPYAWTRHAPAPPTGEFHSSRSTKAPGQTTRVAAPVPSRRSASRVPFRAANRPWKTSGDVPSDIPCATEPGLADAPPAGIANVAASPRSRLPTRQLCKCPATRCGFVEPTNAEQSADGLANGKRPNQSASAAWSESLPVPD